MVGSRGAVVAPEASRLDEFGLGSATRDDVSAVADGIVAKVSTSAGTTAASTVARRGFLIVTQFYTCHVAGGCGAVVPKSSQRAEAER